MKKCFKTVLSFVVVFLLTLTGFDMVTIKAFEGINLEYIFSGEDKDTSGYAQGTITLSSETGGTFYLYWADDNKALDGYYEIAKFDLSDNDSKSFTFDYHTAIPFGATRIIATVDKNQLSVENAVAQFVLPETKLLSANSGKLKYTFNSYSDIHIDPEGFYKNYEEKLTQALNYADKKDTDFILVSGDAVNNGLDVEWDIYQKVLAKSNYKKPVYESNGNHEIRKEVDKGNASFIRGAGTNNIVENFSENKPYYYIQEKSGDIFIFMALEGSYKAHETESFSQEQLTWLENLLDTYYGTGVNIYIVEHAPINNFGAGDRMDNPLYKAHLSQEYTSTMKFKSILEKYPALIWMSGHTHIDFQLGYNYSNENNTACNMIHNSAVVGSTYPDAQGVALDYNDGNGYNSQGYYVEVFENNIVYYGANLTEEKIYPANVYIMEGASKIKEKTPVETDVNLPEYKLYDVDLTGDVTVNDVTEIQKYIAELVEFDLLKKTLSDITQDLKVNIKDATKLQQILAYGNADTSEDVLADAQNVLKENYPFASYNQYQSLKESVLNKDTPLEIQEKILNLQIVANYVGYSGIHNIGDTYYFVNTLNWEEVYGYCWTFSPNASWPGVKLEKVGTYNGKDVYGIKFNSKRQYVNMIFTNGTGTQTVDIYLGDYTGNCFTLTSTDSSGKYNVKSFTYTEAEKEPTVPQTPSEYALRYYNSESHIWDDVDTFFTKQSDGVYVLDFVTENAESMSLNVYNTIEGKFNCIAQSTALTYSSGSENSYNLASSTSRGKSITINGLSKGVNIKFVYDANNNTLKIVF